MLVKALILTAAPETSGSIPKVSGKSAVGAQGAYFSPVAPKVRAFSILRYPRKFSGSFPEANLRNVAMGRWVPKVIQK